MPATAGRERAGLWASRHFPSITVVRSGSAEVMWPPGPMNAAGLPCPHTGHSLLFCFLWAAASHRPSLPSAPSSMLLLITLTHTNTHQPKLWRCRHLAHVGFRTGTTSTDRAAALIFPQVGSAGRGPSLSQRASYLLRNIACSGSHAFTPQSEQRLLPTYNPPLSSAVETGISTQLRNPHSTATKSANKHVTH